MSNIIDAEGTIVSLQHDAITTPHSTDRGLIEKFTGRDDTLEALARQGKIQAFVIQANERLVKLATDANRSIVEHQVESNAELVETTRKITLQAQDKLFEDEERLWADYQKRRENIENNTRQSEHIKARRLKNLDESYGNLSEIFAKRFNSIVLKSR